QAPALRPCPSVFARRGACASSRPIAAASSVTSGGASSEGNAGGVRAAALSAGRVLGQERRQRGRKVYSLHAPECIGKGKAHQPYEFGVKVSVATPVKHSAGGQFVTHAAALPGNPYDGHTLATVIPQMQALIG